MTHHRRFAILLLGPTGAGKTPLGQQIESRGLWNAEFLHFDFGQNLRDVVARGRLDDGITSADVDFLKGVLASGALLEEEQFPIAERVLRSFLARHPEKTAAGIVLNGLPRHAGQAVALSSAIDVRAVVLLACSAETVLRRLAANTGGDRTDRVDDDLKSVERKLDTFRHRTAPLVDHYRKQGTPVETLLVTPTTTPEEAWAELATRQPETKPQLNADGRE